MSRLTLLALGLVIVIALGGGAYYYFNRTSPASPETVQNIPSDWQIYGNEIYGFSFAFPNSYSLGESSTGDTAGLEYLAHITSDSDRVIDVILDPSPFSVEYLRKYAPTGSEDVDPVPMTMGAHTVYYYGPGGGGVCYPDQYFIDFDGQTLIFNVSGCTDDKTPPPEVKALSSQIISTLSLPK